MHTFEPDLSEWDAWPPEHLAARLAGVDLPWCVAGGRALTLFVGRELRAHDDLELAVPATRFAALAARFPDCDFFVAGDGVVSPYPSRADRQHQTWARERAAGRWRFDVFREPSEAGTWICRRDPRIRLPYAAVIERTADGIPYLRPEIVLLFKGKARRQKDEADLAAVVPHLSDDRRRWLADALARVYGRDHPWLSSLAAQ